MSRPEEWDEFLLRLRLRHWEEFKKTREYEDRKQRQEELEGLLADNLSDVEKAMVEDVLWEQGLMAEREGADLYVQGIRDCVWMLKTIGVLA